MENIYSIHLKVSEVENGQYLAVSEDIPGLAAQGRIVSETIEIARDVVKKLIESYIEHGDPIPASLKSISHTIEFDIPVGV